MKKLLITACLTLILATSLVLSACTDGTAPEPIKVSTSSPYSEEAFADIMAEPKDFYLAKDGVSEYAIAVSPNVSGIDTDTKFLQSTLREMTGDDDAFALVDALPKLTPCIAIGFNAAPEGVAGDGYALTYDEDGNIFIDANSSDGLANGIYCFLENELGCMFVRDDYSYIPRLETIALAAEDKIDNPDFRWRRIYQYEVSHEAYESETPTESIWSRRIKSNGTGYRDEDLGNDGNRYWGKWCHSVFSYVPPEQYFDEHPEYYAEIGGVRMHTADDGLPTQLCLTNEELYPIIHDNMAEMMKQYPDAIYWDFSINDSWHMCECADCTAAYEKYGSQMGAMLEIVNRLADDFPDKIISTLAYFYNNVVPEGMTCRDNVNIVIAPIQTSQLYSASDDGNEKSAEAKRMIESWSAICDNLVVWDYTVNFHNLLLPYPNFSVQQSNLEFYKQNNVTGVFHQGSREQGDELACLRSYVLARQLWDIDADIESIIGKYLVVTYGDAAPYLAEYLDRLHESVSHADNLDLYDRPEWHYFDYLSPSNLAKYDELTLAALDAVKDDPQKTLFVKEIRVNVLYARMTAGGFDVVDKEEAFEEFKPLVKELGIERHHEIAPPYIDEYIDSVYPEYLKTQKIHLTLIVVSAAIGATGIVAAAVLIPRAVKKRRKRSNDDQTS